MRILSQDGDYDIPYEQVIIEYEPCERGEDVWYSIRARTSTQCFPIAKYTTEEKAQRAMEMLREEYLKHLFSQGGAMATADFYVPPFAFIPPKVFQFPTDEELED